MDIVQLLPHNRIRFYQLRVAPFFPCLIVGFRFMWTLKPLQYMQNSGRTLLLKVIDNLPSGEGFEPLHIAA